MTPRQELAESPVAKMLTLLYGDAIQPTVAWTSLHDVLSISIQADVFAENQGAIARGLVGNVDWRRATGWSIEPDAREGFVEVAVYMIKPGARLAA